MVALIIGITWVFSNWWYSRFMLNRCLCICNINSIIYLRWFIQQFDGVFLVSTIFYNFNVTPISIEHHLINVLHFGYYFTGSATRLVGKLILFDGKTGEILKVVPTPDNRESYYSPVLYKKRGEDIVVFGTGGETHNGSLWVIKLKDLKDGKMNKVIT